MVAGGGIERPEPKREVIMSHLRYLFSHPATLLSKIERDVLGRLSLRLVTTEPVGS